MPFDQTTNKQQKKRFKKQTNLRKMSEYTKVPNKKRWGGGKKFILFTEKI